jgi:LAGLIDADG-like domain
MALTDEYVAGFFDGDGSIEIERRGLVISFCQKSTNDGVIDLLSHWHPGGTRDERVGNRQGTVTFGARLRFTGKKAVAVVCRLMPHLVTRRAQTNRILRELGLARFAGTDTLPPHPSVEWLAGYFDADGCVYADRNKHGRSATIKLSIDTNGRELDGVRLVQKAFGGAIRCRGKTGNCWRWEISANVAKVEEFFVPIAPYLKVKREQAYFVLSCAKMGHFRDGEIIHRTLRALKRFPHRLSDLQRGVDISRYVSAIRDLEPEAGHRYRHKVGQECSCGSRKLYAKGMCNPCWQKTRYYAKKIADVGWHNAGTAI